jgi:histone deacetylase complex regulatory component SIN3
MKETVVDESVVLSNDTYVSQLLERTKFQSIDDFMKEQDDLDAIKCAETERLLDTRNWDYVNEYSKSVRDNTFDW